MFVKMKHKKIVGNKSNAVTSDLLLSKNSNYANEPRKSLIFFGPVIRKLPDQFVCHISEDFFRELLVEVPFESVLLLPFMEFLAGISRNFESRCLALFEFLKSTITLVTALKNSMIDCVRVVQKVAIMIAHNFLCFFFFIF